MRRIVRNRIAAALEQAKPALEQYTADHLTLPMGFPHNLTPAAVLIREIRKFTVVPLVKADLPPVQVEVLLKAWLSYRDVPLRGDCDPGILDADVQLTAHGRVAPDGTYAITPQSAVLKAWWRDTVVMAGTEPVSSRVQ